MHGILANMHQTPKWQQTDKAISHLVCSPPSEMNNTEIHLMSNSYNGFAVLGPFGSQLGFFFTILLKYPTFDFFKNIFMSKKILYVEVSALEID